MLHTMRRILAASVAAAAAAMAFAATAPTASAEGFCGLYPPTKVVVNKPFQSITVRPSTYCATWANIDWAVWDAYTSKGLEDDVSFESPYDEDYIDIYSWDTLGRWTYRPAFCWSADESGSDCAQNTPVQDRRLGSWGAIAATRSGSTVTLTARHYRYTQMSQTYIPWTGIVGYIQYRNLGSSTWTTLKYTYPNRSGSYTYSYRTSATRDYRLVMKDSTWIWGHTSAVVRR